MKTENRFYVRILSPVHVGCDEVYEPMGFVVDENTCTLTAFDPLDFFRSLNPQDKDRYAGVSRKGTIVSLLELYGLMKGKRFQGHDVKMSKGVVDHYRQTLSMKPSEGNLKRVQQELNNFSIARTAFNEHGNLPYIPGSAIKGSLRTAYLNHLAAVKSVNDDPRDRNAAQTLEKQLLQYDKLEKDPFRLLKVSDFMPVQATTRIVYAVNEKKNISNKPARGPYQILEVIEPGAVFTGTITVEERYAKETGIAQPLTSAVLFKSAGDFYAQEMKREKDELRAAELPVPETVDPDGGWPLRIGRHAGAESVTIEGHRNIKIMQGGDKPAIFSKTGATTLWLASESRNNDVRERLQPFGWAALGRMTEAMNAVFEKTQTEEHRSSNHDKPEPVVEPASEEILAVKETPPANETSDNAFVSFDAGGGGILRAMLQDGKKVELRGRERAYAIVVESLHKKLFEKPRNIPNACVTIRKVGNHYEIIQVEAINK